MEDIVTVGIFWELPSGGVLEFSKKCVLCEADGNGFINYKYSHYEMWDEVNGCGRDCYKYPRGRVLYDINAQKHIIYADKCVDVFAIDCLIDLYGISDYEIRHDEHYVCHSCVKRRGTEHACLEYEVLRGADMIGGNLIELRYGKTRVLVELGAALDGSGSDIERRVLDARYDGIVVSHYHDDHAGLITCKHDCDIYIGDGARRVLSARLCYHDEDLPSNVKPYFNVKSFMVGGIKITPFLCDHSAFDSYMLLFESGGRSILYSGDFRFHGRKPKGALLRALPKDVDVLIHEGTNIGKANATLTESELELRAADIMRERCDRPVFVLQSGTNIDRLVSMYRASKRSGRIFYMDNYTAAIANAAGGRIPRPDVFDDVFAFTPRYISGARRDMFCEIENKRGMETIARYGSRFTMLVRPSMLAYLKKLSRSIDMRGAVLVYSIWNGYKELEYYAEFLNGVEALGMTVVSLHASGHASVEDIELLKRTVNAKQTVCVHTEAYRRD